MNTIKFLVASCIAIFTLACNKPPSSQADMVLLNGKIWTGESDSSFVQAIAIDGNKIMAIGNDADIKKLIGDSTKVIDLNKKLVTAGFNDAHIHFLSGSMILSSADLLATTSLPEMKKVLLDYAQKNPDKPWITGRGWQYGFFEGGMPNKKYLDSLISDRPVFLRAYDGHTGLANTKALELAGITRNTKYTGFGEIVKDANGEPTGAFLEGAQSLMSKVVPETTKEEKLDALRKGMKYAASLGITSMQNANGDVDEYDLYKTLFNNKEMTMRFAMAFSVGAKTTEKEIADFIRLKNEKGDPDWLKGHAIKFMVDGVIESHTAVMVDPYSDIPVNDRMQAKNWNIPLDRYKQLVIQLDKEGFQLYTHAIGDLAVREALNAYAETRRTTQRHRIEHIEQVQSTDIPRFAQLGVLPSMQPIHADPGTVDVWGRAVGNERLPRSFAWQSLLKSGATLVYGADWPACISLNPMRGLHSAVNRRTMDGQPPNGWVPEQKISIADALKAYTVNSAYASFDEKQKGKLAPGFLADLVVLSQDLFTIPTMDIYKTEVMMTMVDGKEVFKRSSKP
ncbi:MAG TPA: amidohydrolase [Chitinophagaceae bacterium]|nr:amidohydrolase [Chitinophagaceae bacterium]